MSRIDIGEVQTFLTQLRTSNENGEKAIQSIQKVVTQYAEDDSLKGKAIDASKRYYQATYISLCDAMKEAMSESEDRLSQYIQDFHAQVDSSANAKIDAAGLYELELKIDKIERNKEDLAQRMNSGTEGQMQNYRSQLSAAYKKENILEKYLSFEQSHGSFFENLTVLVQSIQQTVRELQNNIQFNSQTGTYDMSKLNLSSVSRMQQALNKARGIKEDIVKELQEYTVLAVVYVDSNGKEQVMWLLERDGVGVENAELKAYLEENGKYLNPEDYTIITNEDLNKKINKAWQDGIYYLNGNKYDGLAGGVLSTSAYVEAGKGYVDKSGLADIVLGLGLSTAAIRGSMTYTKMEQNIKNRYPNEVQQGKTFDYTLENGQVKIRDGIKEVDFIIDLQGNLKVGRGHSHLSNGGSVQAAGKLKVDSNGNIRRITNESGHYIPTPGQAKNYQQIFEGAGIKTKNAWLETYQIDVTKSGYVDLAKLKKIDSIKLK
ncbi:hypothetical protein IA817_11215 [Listeria seeligeri]|uniref:LXG domain-containing protein n=1 Tax=Listeria seeligeri TaxID=1640 RepID=A0ABR5EBT4_LISSE|nr:T7SS effector LXG polymorphic toxin [Listeria seeligeri]KKD50585.1 hypothetical protein UQ68_01770 [Listeria seeligeri]MBF2481883.1 hypothetical protein [Listeria seeligeri]MBM5605982.1 hypothetical protein [Listeria seeligeri]